MIGGNGAVAVSAAGNTPEIIPTRVSRLRLFFEWFKISLFIVGGGYAIISVANDVFGRRLKWLKEDELLENLPILSSVPGLIAGNSAVFTGLKIYGFSGAVIALLGVALPSFFIFLGVSATFALVPQGNYLVEGAFLGLRSALSGVVAGSIWRMLFKSRVDISGGVGVKLKMPNLRMMVVAGVVLLTVFIVAVVFAADVLFAFLGFGCVSIGGGFPLIPFYYQAFVGPDAAMLQLAPDEFSNLMALTQMTPGPVSVNAATFFGYRLSGVFGAAVATGALLTPPYFMLTAVLVGLERWKKSRVAAVFVCLLKPVSILLMLAALYRFCGSSVWSLSAAGDFVFNPFAFLLAIATMLLFIRRKLSVMTIVFVSAAAGVVAAVLG